MESAGEGRVTFDWQSVVYRDFDVDLDEPGSRSGAALDALLDDLGVPEGEGWALVGAWAEQLSRALAAGVPALLRRLAHPDVAVRRMVPVVLAYAAAPADAIVPAIREHSLHAPDPAVRLGLLVVLGRYADRPDVRAQLRRCLRGEPADALGAALGLLLRPAPQPGGAPAVVGSGAPSTADGAGPVEDAVVDALALCGGEAGAALGELAWCDPEWAGAVPYGPVDVVDSWLVGAPEVRSRWLTLMLAALGDGRLDAVAARVLVEAADRLCAADSTRYACHAAAVGALLDHPDPAVRRAAVSTNYLHTCGSYLDALAVAASGPAARRDPGVAQAALARLARRGDRRCLAGLREGVAAGTAGAELLCSAAALADDLWPAIRERLAQDLPAAEVNVLLTGTQQWRGGGPAVPEVVAALERLSRRIDATVSGDPDARPEFIELEAASATCAFLRRWGLGDARALAVLRRVAVGADPETGLAAIRALMGQNTSTDTTTHSPTHSSTHSSSDSSRHSSTDSLTGAAADSAYSAADEMASQVIPLLLNVLARRHRPGRLAGRRGWRFDDNACGWLGELGPRAGAAAPALRGMRDDPAEAGALRVAAADALWHITGDVTGALPVLRHFANPGIASATVAATATERASVANEDGVDAALLARAQDALRRIEHEIAAAGPGDEGDDDRPDPAG
ncbi:hypothetical protein [Streptomyces yunnanensis]|uniref:HEAT repeat-containing protein n=1 Tax=Streptomyces yunnanensis TaxID=156453 RepID=A0A9X8MXT2_9ACTN|nr:hypothetical protein [Streptomyces yunnanensis]SHM22107.1 hypothetical protein SAMN05216268_109156 [Streptomyces yunnanensis]